MSRALTPAALMLLVSNCAFGQSQEQNAYCAYVTQEAMAQRSLLLTPNAVGGAIKSNTGTQPQLYWGLSSSLANYSKARLTMESARKNCEAYRATTGASAEIQYALRRLEKEALRHRAELLQQAIEQLDLLINRNLRLVEARNVTRPMLYSVQSVRAKLIADKTNTELKAALLYVPDVQSNLPLKQLVFEKQKREAEAQKSIALLNRQGNWDLKLEGGGRQRLTPIFQNPVEPYGEINFLYNFGARSNNRHLQNAAAAFTDWKTLQDGDVTRNAQILEQQILQSISVQQAEFRALQEQEKEIEGNLQKLAGVDTAAALSFGTQLDADRVVLQVEVKDVAFRLQALQDYLKNNF